MGLIINASDFVGRFYLPNDSNTVDELEAYIELHEETYLRKLLGVTLFNLFDADLDPDGIPQTGIYENIYNPIVQDYNGTIIENKGMRNMVIGFVYWEFMRNYPFKTGVNGKTLSRSENDVPMRFEDVNLDKYYNDSVDSARVIQWYIEQNSDDYPDYNGQCFEITHWAM